MRKLSIAVGSILAALAATSATAQIYYPDRVEWRDSNQECWNPRARHFEEVRPGERQDDLDFGRCRTTGTRQFDNRYDNRYDNRVYRETREECWNPRARHFEEVRRNEQQSDLDFGRCRVVGGDNNAYRYYR